MRLIYFSIFPKRFSFEPPTFVVDLRVIEEEERKVNKCVMLY